MLRSVLSEKLFPEITIENSKQLKSDIFDNLVLSSPPLPQTLFVLEMEDPEILSELKKELKVNLESYTFRIDCLTPRELEAEAARISQLLQVLSPYPNNSQFAKIRSPPITSLCDVKEVFHFENVRIIETSRLLEEI